MYFFLIFNFFILFHVRGMVCFIERYEGLFVFLGGVSGPSAPSPPLVPPCNLAKGYQIVNKFFFFWSSPWDSLLLKFLSVGFTESFSFASNHTLTLYRNPHIVVLTWENNLNFDVALLVLPKRWCNCVRFFFFFKFLFIYFWWATRIKKKKSHISLSIQRKILFEVLITQLRS